MPKIMLTDEGLRGLPDLCQVESGPDRCRKGVGQRVAGQSLGKKAKGVFVDFPRGAVACVEGSGDPE
jgi:hypothetical protein